MWLGPLPQVPLLEGQPRVMPPPKNVFALERTYLTWTHMAVTVRGMQGFGRRRPTQTVSSAGSGMVSRSLDPGSCMPFLGVGRDSMRVQQGPISCVAAALALSVARKYETSRGQPGARCSY